MEWLDVFGPPAVGKSTVCDVFWHPHAIPWQSVREMPEEWTPFFHEVNRLLKEVKDHDSFQACLGMVNRSLKKMAAVHAKDDDRVYIQTGFAQRGLGFGWRLSDPEQVRKYYELMPVSLGVVSLWAPPELIEERNRGRASQGEDRAHMVQPMVRPREIALEVLKKRGVPLLELDTRRDPDELRKQVLEFRDDCRAGAEAFQPQAAGPDREAMAVSPLA